jgi:hypothetical protein
MIAYGPFFDKNGKLYHYRTVDGVTWQKEMLGQGKLDLFTSDEAQAWLENEPNFANRIVTPRRTNRQGDVTRKKMSYMVLLPTVSI